MSSSSMNRKFERFLMSCKSLEPVIMKSEQEIQSRIDYLQSELDQYNEVNQEYVLDHDDKVAYRITIDALEWVLNKKE